MYVRTCGSGASHLPLQGTACKLVILVLLRARTDQPQCGSLTETQKHSALGAVDLAGKVLSEKLWVVLVCMSVLCV